MFNTPMTTSRPAAFGMPASALEIMRDRVASVRALPATQGVVSLPAGSVRATGVQGTTVCGYSHITDLAVAVKGAFPGTSAWSPPI